MYHSSTYPMKSGVAVLMSSQVLQRQGVLPRDCQRQRGAFGNDKGITRPDTKYIHSNTKGVWERHRGNT